MFHVFKFDKIGILHSENVSFLVITQLSGMLSETWQHASAYPFGRVWETSA